MDKTIITICWLLGVALIVGITIYFSRKGLPVKKKKFSVKSPLPKRPKFEFTEDEVFGLNEIWQQTSLPCINLTPVRKATGVFDSKLGGVPYLPLGFEYPYNTDPQSDKRPLKLLAQLNFSQLPRLDGYPAEGILQFYIANEVKSDLYGLNLDNQTEQSGWRVVYHKDIITDESRLQAPPALESGNEVYFPFIGEFALEAQKADQPITCSDYRWQDFMENTLEPTALCQSLKERCNEDDIEDLLRDAACEFGFRIGGYPAFTQEDPRGYGKNTDHTVLLLQLDSWSETGDPGIMFGDSGVANWFITPEALTKCDFSDVLYNWDCY